MCWFKYKKHTVIDPVLGRAEYFKRQFDCRYGFMSDWHIATDTNYESVREYYAQEQEKIYQDIIKFVDSNCIE